MTWQQRIDEIEAKMAACAESGDTEAAHAEADDLLLDLIAALTDQADASQVHRIVALYEKVDKWFS